LDNLIQRSKIPISRSSIIRLNTETSPWFLIKLPNEVNSTKKIIKEITPDKIIDCVDENLCFMIDNI
jgi:CRISPR/Cas system CSM-associated protein Csm4 (group 5 of RAMP superfamily)